MVGRTDAELIAYAVMPNHLHLIVRQGETRLQSVMQPLLCRVAHRVQKHHGFEGGVVERRYRDRACRSAKHVRAAIIYTHLNPWRAGLCADPVDYPWTTQQAYQPGADPTLFGVDPNLQLRVLELFATEPGQPRDPLCRSYAQWLERRMRLDDLRRASADDAALGPPPARPAAHIGDLAWGHFTRAMRRDLPGDRTRPDLRDFTYGHLGRIAPDLKPEQLRGSWVSRPIGRIRMRLVRAAIARGFGTCEIARFFDISPQTVSRMKYAPGDP